MATLVFRGPDGRDHRAELTDELTVGRDASNACVLSDKSVSRRHCRFFVDTDGKAWVEDLGSANGVRIAGVRISEQTEVPAGAEIQIGQFKGCLEPARSAALARRPVRSGSLSQRPRGEPPSSMAGSRAPRPRTTRMITSSEMPSRRPGRAALAPPPAAELEAAELEPQLRGVTGPWAGRIFKIEKPTELVGRVEPADVLIDDDSVSRRHAELRRSGSTLVLCDLGSANGTFVNGSKITEAPLANGDTIRFGVVELIYSGPDGGRALQQRAKRKRFLMVAGGGLGGVMLLGIALALSGPPPAETTDHAQAEAGPARVDPTKLLGMCRLYGDPDGDSLNWEQAAETCEKVLALDPTLAEARSVLRLAKKELGSKALLEDANLKISASQDDAALKLLVQIDKSSTYFSRARSQFKEAADRIAKRTRTACKTEMAARWPDRAFDACQRNLEVTCNRAEGPDGEARKLFEKAAKQLGRPAEFKCPPEYAVFLAPSMIDTAEIDVEKAIREKYSDALVAVPMVRYFREGKPKQVADELKRVRVRHKGKFGTSLDDLIAALDVIDGRYTSGQAGLLRGKPEQTESYWKQALEEDAKILPPEAKSYLHKDMSAQLADAYHAVGMEELKKQKPADAFQAFLKGYQYNRANHEILVQITGMESDAQARLTEEPSCETVGYALGITLDESAAHKKAQELQKQLNCP